MSAIGKNLRVELQLEPFESCFQPSPIVIETCTGKNMCRRGFETRQARRRFIDDALELSRLLAQ
jgi:hypothetical protein